MDLLFCLICRALELEFSTYNFEWQTALLWDDGADLDRLNQPCGGGGRESGSSLICFM